MSIELTRAAERAVGAAVRREGASALRVSRETPPAYAEHDGDRPRFVLPTEPAAGLRPGESAHSQGRATLFLNARWSAYLNGALIDVGDPPGAAMPELEVSFPGRVELDLVAERGRP